MPDVKGVKCVLLDIGMLVELTSAARSLLTML